MWTWISDRLTRLEDFFELPKLLFDGWQSTARIALTSVFAYLILLLLLRIFGSRSVSSFSVYDTVTTITIGSVISSTLILEEINLINGFIAILVLLVMQYAVSKLLEKSKKLYQLTNPSPTVVFYKGEYKKENMSKRRVNQEEILSAIRKKSGTTSD